MDVLCKRPATADPCTMKPIMHPATGRGSRIKYGESVVPVLPPDETARIAALHQYGILDTPAEPKFDRITRLVSNICEAPIALITMVDSERQWFKSGVGLEATETPRDISFCAHAILQDTPLIVPDATTDDRFQNNPLVLGPPNIRTYLGAPLVSRDGYRIGTLCALYAEVTPINDIWKEHLTALAAIVVDELELRVALADAEAAASAAAESESRFRDIAEASGEWIWETDADHRFTYISDRNASSLFPRSRLIGLKRWELPPFRNDRSQFEVHRETLSRHEPFRRFEYDYVDNNGRRQYRQTSGNPVFDRDGNFKGYRGTTTDITDQVEGIEDLKAATAAA
jgi:PAS domain S-box-containing protein